MRLICENCNVRSNQIGAIDLGRDTSFFEVSKEIAGAIRTGTQDMTLDGRRVSIRSASGGPNRPQQQQHHRRRED